jgi:hypothetical protein
MNAKSSLRTNVVTQFQHTARFIYASAVLKRRVIGGLELASIRPYLQNVSQSFQKKTR